MNTLKNKLFITTALCSTLMAGCMGATRADSNLYENSQDGSENTTTLTEDNMSNTGEDSSIAGIIEYLAALGVDARQATTDYYPEVLEAAVRANEAVNKIPGISIELPPIFITSSDKIQFATFDPDSKVILIKEEILPQQIYNLEAIIAHEFGHAAEPTSSFPYMFQQTINKIDESCGPAEEFLVKEKIKNNMAINTGGDQPDPDDFLSALGKTSTEMRQNLAVIPFVDEECEHGVANAITKLALILQKQEYRADSVAVRAGYGNELADFFSRFRDDTENMAGEITMSVHPPDKERINRIQQLIMQQNSVTPDTEKGSGWGR